MISRRPAAAVLALAATAVACELPYVPPPTSSGPASNPIHAHAHNDYEHGRPLFDALDHGFDSVEADVWLDGDAVGVSHDGPPSQGTLRDLYLDPLAALVEANGGSVHGDDRPFFLWLDVKPRDPELQLRLAAELAAYPMLARFDDAGEATPGAVTVVLTGCDAAKRALVERPAPRPYLRDSNTYDFEDPSADGRWGFYSLALGDYLAWNGLGALPDAQRERLRGLVDDVHAKGRRLRLYGTPDGPAYWSAAIDSGVDFINTDTLAALADVL
jgi:hypothetical protein